MTHLLKGFIEVIAAPLTLACLLALAAAIARWSGRLRVTRALIVCAVSTAYLGSIPLTGALLLRPLETRFQPLASPLRPVDYVVVLGSGLAPSDGVPITAALDEIGLVRVTEGVRLWRSLPAARLIVSGGAPAGRVPPARGYSQLARSLGVPAQSIIVSDQSLDTAAEARAIRALLGATPFLLVTSACHMPRAILLMRRAGADPIPAPTGQLVRAGAGVTIGSALLPGARGLRDTELAIHEYLGLAAIEAGLE
jgi:uncharacterized SAM-binding protein YcdF (DUF218 family)